MIISSGRTGSCAGMLAAGIAVIIVAFVLALAFFLALEAVVPVAVNQVKFGKADYGISAFQRDRNLNR